MEAMLLYHDCSDENGPRLLPIHGGIFDQPLKLWMMWRVISGAHSQETARELKKAKKHG